jgi:hypothetical protein
VLSVTGNDHMPFALRIQLAQPELRQQQQSTTRLDTAVATVSAAKRLDCVCGGAAQVFPTQHVWLRARCRSIKVQLLGYALDDAPQHIRVGSVGPEPQV